MYQEKRHTMKLQNLPLDIQEILKSKFFANESMIHLIKRDTYNPFRFNIWFKIGCSFQFLLPDALLDKHGMFIQMPCNQEWGFVICLNSLI